MTFTTSIALWASGTALLFSIGALVATVLSWRQSLKNSAARLRQQLLDLTEAVEDQAKLIRQLKSRYTMQNLRLAREAQPPGTPVGTDPDAAAAEARRNLNDALARGQVKVNP